MGQHTSEEGRWDERRARRGARGGGRGECRCGCLRIRSSSSAHQTHFHGSVLAPRQPAQRLSSLLATPPQHWSLQRQRMSVRRGTSSSSSSTSTEDSSSPAAIHRRSLPHSDVVNEPNFRMKCLLIFGVLFSVHRAWEPVS